MLAKEKFFAILTFARIGTGFGRKLIKFQYLPRNFEQLSNIYAVLKFDR